LKVLAPTTLDEALAMRAEHPGSTPIAGGTDLLVDLNFDRIRPEVIIDVSRLGELAEWGFEDGYLFLGAGVTYAAIMRELREFVPLVQASRTVGSPQIRNRGTVGGNLGTASPAGDALPVLAAYDADIVVGSAGNGRRHLRWDEFLVGPKQTALEPDELILGARWAVVRGPGSFSKVGSRNAMVISVAGLCLQVDDAAHSIRVALGSVAPTVVRSPEAEAFATEAMEEAGSWDDPAAGLPEAAIERFGELVAETARPIDDVRATAAFRRHACGVLGRRALSWALAEREAAAEL
jgi:CO/xanthine dehydrogenase FAD-binding subunit